jgi:lysophospholipase L1-like esterase
LKDATGFLSVKLAFDGSAEAQISYDVYYRTRAPSDRLLLSFGSERRELGLSDATTTVGGLSVGRFRFKGASSVEIRALRGAPQVFGIVAETERPGFVIDTLGINGARFGTFLAWEERSFQALFAQRQPLVAVIAYGTNEVYDEEPVTRHAARLEQVVDRLRGALPDVGCLVVGPTDVGRGGEAAASRVAAVDQAEHTTAERLGCAYFSPYELMAAEGGFIAWRDRDPPLALSDGIHLTAKGYARLGEAMARRYLVAK